MFERFTGDARTAVVLAQVQARDLGHDYIGTEHLLLALLSTEASGLKAMLAALGVTSDDVKAEILGIVGRGGGAGSGHIPFTPRSKKVLELSLREALALKHNTIQPEHILLGLLREGEGLAAQILFKRGVDLGRLRQEVLDTMPAGTRRGLRGRRAPDPGRRPMTGGAVKVAERAAHHAGEGPVASQHFLLGLLDDDESLATKALAALGISRHEVEAKLAELGTQGTSDEPPEQWGARNTSLAVDDDVITVRVGDADLAARTRAMLERLHVDMLRGAHLPGAERIWLAVRPAVEETVARLEATTAEATEWEPPGWTKGGMANYAMVSKPGGPSPKLWLTADLDEAEVRRFLAEWLRARPPGQGDDEVIYLTVSVSRAGDVVPDAADPDALVVSHWSSGAGGPRLDWPRVPLAQLVAAAVDDLSQEPAA